MGLLQLWFAPIRYSAFGIQQHSLCPSLYFTHSDYIRIPKIPCHVNVTSIELFAWLCRNHWWLIQWKRLEIKSFSHIPNSKSPFIAAVSITEVVLDNTYRSHCIHFMKSVYKGASPWTNASVILCVTDNRKLDYSRSNFGKGTVLLWLLQSSLYLEWLS